jgi:hypothetical protein
MHDENIMTSDRRASLGLVTPWVQTFTARKVDLLTPQPEQIALLDISTSLSRLPRFNGHTNLRWSVADHSLLVEALVRRADHDDGASLAALLHDAHEAYSGDIASPMKVALRMLGAHDALQLIEQRLQSAIHARFGLPWPLSNAHRAAIHLADLQALRLERDVLMKLPPADWTELPDIIDPPTLWPAEEKTTDATFFNRVAELLDTLYPELSIAERR